VVARLHSIAAEDSDRNQWLVGLINSEFFERRMVYENKTTDIDLETKAPHT
jgi:hypothetical protein